MPDPSGEPAPPSHEQAGSPRPPASAGEPSHLAPAPRTHPTAVQHAKPASNVPPPQPGSRAILDLLRQFGVELDPDDATTPAAREDPRSTQARLPKEQRKFHRFDPEHPQPALPSAGTAATPRPGGTTGGHADLDSSPDDDLRGITVEQLASIHRLGDHSSERRLWIALGIAVLALLGVTAALVASRLSSSKATADTHEQAVAVRTVSDPSEVAETLTPGVMELLDQAMAAETAAHYAKAVQLFEQARHDAGHIRGLDFHLASLCYRANQMTQVIPLLNLSISEGEDVAACYSLRGSLLSQAPGTPQQPGDLEKATRLEPFDARFFFAWGEALRRAGKPELARPQLQRAVERLQEPALASAYALKLHLTQIELEQGDALNGEIAEKLKEAPPSSDWLLTSAALEMQRGDYPAAAQALDRLRTQYGEREMVRQLQDVFFKRYTHQPELTRFFDEPVMP